MERKVLVRCENTEFLKMNAVSEKLRFIFWHDREIESV